ncbi:MAG: hypothetical protein ACTMKY_00025 [Dermabacteraceae bacterium]
MPDPDPDPDAVTNAVTDPSSDSEPHERFTPPPAAPVSQAEARSNVLLAAVLSGAGCLLVLLVVLALMLFGGVGVPR